MKLQCKNPECDSRVDDQTEPMFTVNLTVDNYGYACENSQSIQGKFHTCCHCGGKAEWIEN